MSTNKDLKKGRILAKKTKSEEFSDFVNQVIVDMELKAKNKKFATKKPKVSAKELIALCEEVSEIGMKNFSLDKLSPKSLNIALKFNTMMNDWEVNNLKTYTTEEFEAKLDKVKHG